MISVSTLLVFSTVQAFGVGFWPSPGVSRASERTAAMIDIPADRQNCVTNSACDKAARRLSFRRERFVQRNNCETEFEKSIEESISAFFSRPVDRRYYGGAGGGSL